MDPIKTIDGAKPSDPSSATDTEASSRPDEYELSIPSEHPGARFMTASASNGISLTTEQIRACGVVSLKDTPERHAGKHLAAEHAPEQIGREHEAERMAIEELYGSMGPCSPHYPYWN